MALIQKDASRHEPCSRAQKDAILHMIMEIRLAADTCCELQVLVLKVPFWEGHADAILHSLAQPLQRGALARSKRNSKQGRRDMQDYLAAIELLTLSE